MTGSVDRKMKMYLGASAGEARLKPGCKRRRRGRNPPDQSGGKQTAPAEDRQKRATGNEPENSTIPKSSRFTEYR
jgi:hypothetical protein